MRHSGSGRSPSRHCATATWALARPHTGRGDRRRTPCRGAWLADPRSAPHGGESLLEFITRIGGWLDTRPAEDAAGLLAVAEPAVVRAALVYVLKAPPHAYWRIDVQPLSVTTLTGRSGKWDLLLEA